MTALDVLAACSRAVDRAICAALEHDLRQRAAERRAVLERRPAAAGPGARRRPDRPEWTWRWATLRNRVARFFDRLRGRRP